MPSPTWAPERCPRPPTGVVCISFPWKQADQQSLHALTIWLLIWTALFWIVCCSPNPIWFACLHCSSVNRSVNHPQQTPSTHWTNAWIVSRHGVGLAWCCCKNCCLVAFQMTFSRSPQKCRHHRHHHPLDRYRLHCLHCLHCCLHPRTFENNDVCSGILDAPTLLHPCWNSSNTRVQFSRPSLLPKCVEVVTRTKNDAGFYDSILSNVLQWIEHVAGGFYCRWRWWNSRTGLCPLWRWWNSRTGLCPL